jgi:hypothetical protein
MSPKVKKLLYQLEHEVVCSIDHIFDREECRQFDSEVGNGIALMDTDGRLVVRFAQPAMIIVAKGYRWDGCSPKFNILDLSWIGTPDGAIIGSERPTQGPDADCHIPITHERVTHRASVVHDVLGYCKYDSKMPSLFRASREERDLWLSRGRRNRDRLFFELLKMKNHRLARVYFFAVYLLGPLYDLWRGIHSS